MKCQKMAFLTEFSSPENNFIFRPISKISTDLRSLKKGLLSYNTRFFFFLRFDSPCIAIFFQGHLYKRWWKWCPLFKRLNEENQIRNSHKLCCWSPKGAQILCCWSLASRLLIYHQHSHTKKKTFLMATFFCFLSHSLFFVCVAFEGPRSSDLSVSLKIQIFLWRGPRFEIFFEAIFHSIRAAFPIRCNHDVFDVFFYFENMDTIPYVFWNSMDFFSIFLTAFLKIVFSFFSPFPQTSSFL